MDKPTFREIAPDVYSVIKDCDLAGYNLIAYDVPILVNELKRAGISYSIENVHFVDIMKIYKMKERRNLSAAYRFYCQQELEGAHSALKDTQATFDIFKAQMIRYADLPKSVDMLHQFCTQPDDRFVDGDKKFIWQDGEACFTFGKHKGSPLKNVVKDDAEYISWMLGQDFSAEVQQIIRSALKGRFPVRQGANSQKND